MGQETKQNDRLRKTTRNILDAASFRVNQYKQVVQKKIDLGALYKKIEQFQAELGKEVDERYQAGQKDFIANKPIARLLEKLASLKQAAVLLEEEIEQIRNETQQANKKNGAENKNQNCSGKGDN